MFHISLPSLRKHGSSSSEGGGMWYYHVIAFIIVTIWGGTLVSSKLLIQAGMAEHEIFIARALIAYVAIWPFAPGKLWARTWRDELLFLFIGMLGGSLYFILENFAVGLTLVNNVSFIVSLSPLITVFLARLFWKGMRLSTMLLTGSAIAVVGVGLIIYGGQTDSCGQDNLWGDILALLSALCFGIYSLLVKVLGKGYSSTFITRKLFAYGFLTALPWLLAMPWQFEFARFLQADVLFNLLFLALVASFGCFLLWNVTVGKLGAVVTSNYIYVSPIATVVISYLFLGEQMCLLAYIGSAAVLLGVIIANKNMCDC